MDNEQNRVEFNEGDRVFSYELDGSQVFGTIHKNKDNPDVSEWYIRYDDGEECAVLDISIVFHASQPPHHNCKPIK